MRRALRKGRAALFADCGLGKTYMQLAWGYVAHQHSGGDVLILAPLAVNAQTIYEGEKLGIAVQACRTQEDVRPGLNIANYELLSHFDPWHFAGVVLDESSILKSYMGKTKRALVEATSRTTAISPLFDNVTGFTVTLDGVNINDPLSYRFFSPAVFSFSPSLSMVSFDSCVTQTPMQGVVDGFYLLFKPMPPGQHTIVLIGHYMEGVHVTLTEHLTVQ